MSKPLRAQDEASSELDQAASWYEQRRTGLGLRFLSSLDATLDQVVRFPQAGSPVSRIPPDLTIRRAPVRCISTTPQEDFAC